MPGMATETTDSEVLADGPAASALAAQLLADEPLAAGTPGLWQVWGARAIDIRLGDVVLTSAGPGTLLAEEVAAIAETIVGVAITTPSGAKFRLGGLNTGFLLFRPGDRATLA